MNIRNLYGLMLVLFSCSSLMWATQEWEAYFSSHALMIRIQDEKSNKERLVFLPLSTLQETNMGDDEPNLFLIPLSKMLFDHEGVSIDHEGKYIVDHENPSECSLRIFELVNAGNNDQKMNVVVVGLKDFNKHFCFVLQPYLRIESAKIIVSTRDPLQEQFKNDDDALFDQLNEEGVFDNHPGPKKFSWFEGVKMKYGGSLVYYINNFCSYVSKKCNKWFQ